MLFRSLWAAVFLAIGAGAIAQVIVEVGRAYRYEPVSSREAYTAALMNDAWATSDNPAAALVHFFGLMSPEQREALRDALRVTAVLPAEPDPPEPAGPSRGTGETGGGAAR